MLFNEFGKKENPPVLLLHGMMQDWHSEYQILKPLEEHYRLIIPAQDGFYDGSEDFTSNETMVHMWCGSKEPYALKSHKELKRYLKNYKEVIMNGFGHGEFLLKHSDKCCEKIRKTFENR